MFFVFLTLFCLVFSAACFWRYGFLKRNSDKDTDYDGGGFALIIIAFVVVLICLISTGVAWNNQINDFEDIKKFEELETIYQDKATALTAQFVKFLSQEYPAHEREIFKEIGPEKVLLYFVKYPEIQASKTLGELVSRISELENDKYQQKINAAEARKRTRVRLRDPWLVNYVIPRE